jgi:hypothetical protein
MRKVGGLVLPETSPSLLAQRTPGETDLRIFTAEVVPAGRHRVDPRRPGLRVVRNRQTGRAALRASLPDVRADNLARPSGGLQASR